MWSTLLYLHSDYLLTLIRICLSFKLIADSYSFLEQQLNYKISRNSSFHKIFNWGKNEQRKNISYHSYSRKDICNKIRRCAAVNGMQTHRGQSDSKTSGRAQPTHSCQRRLVLLCLLTRSASFALSSSPHSLLPTIGVHQFSPFHENGE